MGYRIEYQYNAGDVIRQAHSVMMANKEPDGPTLGGSTSGEVVSRVLQVKDGIFTVSMESRTLSGEGLLKANAGLHSKAVFTMEPNGAMLSCSNPQVPLVTQGFPKEEVEVGHTWKTMDLSNPAQPMSTTYKLHSVENTPSGSVALIASEGFAENESEKSQTLIQSTQRFHLALGHQLESTTVIKTVYKDGRTSDMVVESKLTERSSS